MVHVYRHTRWGSAVRHHNNQILHPNEANTHNNNNKIKSTLWHFPCKKNVRIGDNVFCIKAFVSFCGSLNCYMRLVS